MYGRSFSSVRGRRGRFARFWSLFEGRVMVEERKAPGRCRDEALAPSPVVMGDLPGSAPVGRSRRRKPRMPGFEYEGRYGYHVTIVTHDRRPSLTGIAASQAVDDLKRAADATSFELLAYCVMPDHVHALPLGIEDDARLLRFVQRFKQLTGHRFSQTHPKPFWQQSFYDHVLRHDEDVLHVARYILGNPIEAGLISPDKTWPFSGGTLVAETDGAPNGDQRDGAKASSLHPQELHPRAAPAHTDGTGDTS